MKIIVIANQKGGCAKTTTIVNLAAGLSLQGKRVMVIDLDPQVNATHWLGVQSESENIIDLYDGIDLYNVIVKTSIDNVYAIPGSKHLAGLEKRLSSEVVPERILKAKLQPLSSSAEWDYVLIDTPPTLGLITLSAFSAAEYLLVPVSAHVLSLLGVAQLIERFQSVKEFLNPKLEILGFLPTRVDARTRHSQEVVESLIEHFQDKVLKSKISESVRLAEAPSFKKCIFDYKSNSKSAREFAQLAIEIESLIG